MCLLRRYAPPFFIPIRGDTYLWSKERWHVLIWFYSLILYAYNHTCAYINIYTTCIISTYVGVSDVVHESRLGHLNLTVLTWVNWKTYPIPTCMTTFYFKADLIWNPRTRTKIDLRTIRPYPKHSHFKPTFPPATQKHAVDVFTGSSFLTWSVQHTCIN